MGPEARRSFVPSASRKKSSPKRGASPRARPARPAAKPKPTKPSKAAAKAKPPAKKATAPSKTVAAEPEAPVVLVPRTGDGRRHVLSLSFLRDGDEFYARMETDAGQITELKNRSLDQLLSLVANELEDLLE